MIGPMTHIPMYLVQHDHSTLIPGEAPLAWEDLEKLVKQQADLTWVMHGQPRVLLQAPLAEMWQGYRDRSTFFRLDRTEIGIPRPLYFRRDQTLSLEEYFQDLWQEHGESPE